MKLTADEVDEIMALERACFSHPWARSDFEFELSCPDSVFLGAKDNEKTVGFVILRLEGDQAEVYNIAVDASVRRGGIGGKLLDTALEVARAAGVQSVFLEVRASNLPARGLYASRGFEQVGIRKKYYDLPTEDAIVMAAQLVKGEKS